MGIMKRGMGDSATHAPRPLPYDWQLFWLERQLDTRSHRVGVLRALPLNDFARDIAARNSTLQVRILS